MKKAFWVGFCFLFVFLLCILGKLFIIGEPVDGAQLAHQVTLEGQTLHLHVTIPESAVALRGWKIHQEGSTLYIRCRKVLVSPFFSSGEFHTALDTVKLDQIYLGGRLIWAAYETRKDLAASS